MVDVVFDEESNKWLVCIDGYRYCFSEEAEAQQFASLQQTMWDEGDYLNDYEDK